MTDVKRGSIVSFEELEAVISCLRYLAWCVNQAFLSMLDERLKLRCSPMIVSYGPQLH